MEFMASLNEDAHLTSPEELRTKYLAGDFTPTLSIGEPSSSHISIIMCLWNRPGRITEILNMLAGQRRTTGIDLYFWNNCEDDHELYEAAIREHGLSGALRSIHLIKSAANLGSMSRFYIVRKLAKEGLAGPIIVLDDDEVVTPHFVRIAVKRYDPKVVTAWWAFTMGEQYWRDKKPAKRRDRVDHIGPGGMICDSHIFLDDGFFTELPDKYWLLDDIWLSYYVRSKGYQLKKLDVAIEFVLGEKNQWYSLVDLKSEFFEELYNR